MTGTSLFYCSPGEAAAQIGDTLEHVRQRVRWGPGKPGRLPLYALLKTSRKVIWAVIPSEKDPNYSGPEDGEAELFQGGHLEIDHSESSLLAASPEETFLVRTLRAPAEGLGETKPIPGGAVLYIRNEDQGISVNFSQCLIAERDLFGAECQPKTKPNIPDTQINAVDETPENKRQLNNNLTLIGCLLELLMTAKPSKIPAGDKPQYVDQGAVEKELLDRFGNVEGLGHSTIKTKFAEANRLLKERRKI